MNLLLAAALAAATAKAPQAAPPADLRALCTGAATVQPKAGELTQSPELLNALKVLGGLSREMRSKLKAISAPSIDATQLTLNGDVQVMIGNAEDIQKKDAVALAVMAGHKNVVYVNVRVVDRPTWRGLGQTK